MCSSSGGCFNVTIPDAVQYNFDLLTMSIWCSKHVEARNKLTVKQILCIKLDNYSDKPHRVCHLPCSLLLSIFTVRKNVWRRECRACVTSKVGHRG